MRLWFIESYCIFILLLQACGKPTPAPIYKIPAASLVAYKHPAPPQNQSLVFAVIGDMGTGDENQYQVGKAMAAVCAQKSCSFVLGLGDNVYDTGVSSIDDPSWQQMFEKPYKDLDIPFYMTLGNHDYGQNPEAQVAYTKVSKKWKMPATYYNFTTKSQGVDLQFLALDTMDMGSTQKTWLTDRLKEYPAKWRIAYGHHPWLSNGAHGNGSSARQKFFESTMCNKVDLYLAGHDHNKEHLDPKCGVHMIILGSSGKLRPINPGANSKYASSTLGFGVFIVGHDSITVEFYNENQQLEYTNQIR